MKRALALSLCLALATAHAPALAQTPEQVTAARKKFELALDLEKKGEWKAALTLLRDVAAVKSTSQVRFHIALCLERTGRLVAAREEYQRSKEEAETKEGAEGLTMQKKASERIADLDARIPKLEFSVPEDVVTAKLSVDDGDPISLTVQPVVPVDPGEHELVVTSPGRKPWKQKISVAEKAPTQKIELKLVAEGEPEPEAAREEPAAKPPPPPAPAPAPVPETPARRDDWDRYALPMVIGGVGALSLATAGVMYILRGSTISDMDEACGPSRDRCPNNLRSTEDRGRSYTTAGNILLGVGAAAVGAAVVIYAVDPMKKTTTTVGASASPTAFSLGITGHF